LISSARFSVFFWAMPWLAGSSGGFGRMLSFPSSWGQASEREGLMALEIQRILLSEQDHRGYDAFKKHDA
jgi:hypothetical protein